MRLALFVVSVRYLLQHTDRDALGALLGGLDPGALVPLLLTSLSVLMLLTLRWVVISHALALRLSFGRAFSILWLSQAFGEIGPPLLVGEGLRFFGLEGRGSALVRIMSQAVDRLSGLLMLLLLLLIDTVCFRSEPLSSVVRPDLLLVGAVLLGLALWGLFSRWEGLRRPACVMGIRLLAEPRALAHYALSLMIHLALILNLVWAGQAVDAGVSSDLIMRAGPWILAATTLIPGFLSDWGKREMAVILLLGDAGVAENKALALSLLYGVSHLLVALPGFLVPLWISLKDSK